MRNRGSFVIVAVVTSGLCAAFSCKTFNLPNETCDPSHLHGAFDGGTTDSVCNRCLEDHCCEEVGVCDRSDPCLAVVMNVHQCVLGAGLQGAHDEMGCATNNGLGVNTPADKAYRCMRSACGNECGLPVCKVDPAAVLIQTAECDACFSSSCCSELNRCYGSRACKLTIECIVNNCGKTLGDSLTADPSRIAADVDAGGLDICDAGAPPVGPADLNAKCVHECVCTFQNHDQGLTPAENTAQPARLALAVYECGQRAGCAARCPRSPPDASTPPSADASSDAASDAASEDGADAPRDAP